MKKNSALGYLVAAGLCAAMAGTASALSFDLSHGNAVNFAEDQYDTASGNVHVYEDFAINFSNPGAEDLSIVSEFSLTNQFAPLDEGKFLFRSLFLDWNKAAGNAGIKFGRQFLSEVSAPPIIFDGGIVRYEGKKIAARVYGGWKTPSLLEDKAIAINSDGFASGAWLDVTPVRGLALGAGVHEDRGRDSAVQVRVAASAQSLMGRLLGINGAVRFETMRQAFEYYTVRGKLRAGGRLNIGLHFLGRSEEIDSVNFYTRMFLKKYNETGISAGACFFRDAWVNAEYALRFIADGVDQKFSAGLSFKGASVRIGSISGVSGTNVCFIPAYTFKYRKIAELGISASVWHYKDTSGTVSRTASVVALESRLFVPWINPAADFMIQPRVEYLTNRYYRQDVRLWLLTTMQFHSFRQSDSIEEEAKR